jgi:hypothetical protein
MIVMSLPINPWRRRNSSPPEPPWWKIKYNWPPSPIGEVLERLFTLSGALSILEFELEGKVSRRALRAFIKFNEEIIHFILYMSLRKKEGLERR